MVVFEGLERGGVGFAVPVDVPSHCDGGITARLHPPGTYPRASACNVLLVWHTRHQNYTVSHPQRILGR